MFLHRISLGGGGVRGSPGQVPVDAGAAVGVNVERPQDAKREDESGMGRSRVHATQPTGLRAKGPARENAR